MRKRIFALVLVALGFLVAYAVSYALLAIRCQAKYHFEGSLEDLPDWGESILHSSTVKVIALVEDPALVVPGSVERGKVFLGTGFFVSADKVVTAAHVVDENVSEISGFLVEDFSCRRFPVRVEFTDAGNDFAVLSLDVEAGSPISISDSSEFAPGEMVYFIGYTVVRAGTPGDYIVTLAEGITREESDFYSSWSSEAEVSRGRVGPGNSGGPILDSQGDVVGFVWGGTLDGENMYFVSASVIRNFFAQDLWILRFFLLTTTP